MVSYLQADPESTRIIPAHDWAPYGVMAIGGIEALAGLCTFVIRLVSLVFGIRLLGGVMWEQREAQNMG